MDDAETRNRLVLAAVPVLNFDPEQEAEYCRQLETYLTQATGLNTRVIVPRSYDEVLAGMEQGKIDAARLGPYAFALAQARFGAKALVNAVSRTIKDKDRPAPYRSIIFTRADSGITSLAQLKGLEFGFVDPNSTTGYLVATFLLQQAGLDAAHDLKPHFLLSHKAVADAVIHGDVVAGAVQEAEFVRLSEASETPALRVLAASPLIPKGPVAVRPNLPRQLERKLQTALIQIHQQDPQIYQLITASDQRFTPATQGEITLKTIAELSGVSYATVSRAINGRDRVAPGTTSRILKLVEELGYRPNANARSLQKPAGELVGLFLPTLDFPGLDEIVAGAQTVLNEAGLRLVVCPVGKSDRATGTAKTYFELLYNNRLAGVILTQRSLAGDTSVELARSGRSAILLEQDLLENALPTLSDWFQERGLTKIALVKSQNPLLEPENARLILTRSSGSNFEYVTANDHSVDWLESLFQKEPLPDALLCLDDQTALIAAQFCQERYPGVVVTGFGNSSLAQWAKLPSLDFDKTILGRNAALRLLKLLDFASETKLEPLQCWVNDIWK
jgi:phosphonate transport system substrate-binding protein